MFIRTFLYSLKSISRNKVLVGWNLLFPLVLATAFYLGFGNLIKDDPNTFTTIEVGYVNTDSPENSFEEVLAELSKENDNQIQVLSLHKYKTRDDAMTAMKESEVAGVYVLTDDDVETILPRNGYNATILNQIVREYDNTKTLIDTIAAEHPENVEKVINSVYEDSELLSQYSFGENTSQYLQYFFSLLAMASLFSSWISTHILSGMCANQTENGKRFECAPVNKLVSILAGVLAGLVVQSVSNAITVIYIEYVLKISFGIPLGIILMITTIGSGLGITAGVFFGSILKSEKLLIAVPLVFTMSCSFFSGLMWGQIRQLIEHKCPIFNRINPAALLTDSLYVRATYGATDLYYRNITTMFAMIIILLVISSLFLRRRKYVSL